VIDYFVSGATPLFELGDVLDGGHRDIFHGSEFRSAFCAARQRSISSIYKAIS
jgi:hypothetical protein